VAGNYVTFTAVPIIFLTALSNTSDIVRGLQLGADDYITKPFEHAEFLARVSAHLRRHIGPGPNRLSFAAGALEIDLANYLVFINGEELELTPREFSLLAVLAQNAGRVVATESLLEDAWGEAYVNAKQNIKPYIHYLRKKIELDPAAPKWIKTVRGVGYRFNIEES
jgi:DNA-binding response OmpR family regulator